MQIGGAGLPRCGVHWENEHAGCGKESGIVTTTRLDRVSIFGEQLSFLIPHEWEESDEDGKNYLYHAPKDRSGWLRVSLISIKKNCSREELRSLLDKRAVREDGRLFEAGDNLVVAWEKQSQEDGEPITHFWWAVGHYHEPTLSHEAMFSFTVLTEQKTASETVETVALLNQLVAQAEFAPSRPVD